MRTIGRLACVLMLAVISLSCDTTQPLLLDQQVFQLSVRATGSIVRVMNVYPGYEDSNNDGQPDGPDFMFCKWRTSGGAIVTRGPTSVPWNYTVDISVLRAGTTEPELIVSEAAVLDETSSLTAYDQTDQIFGSVPVQPTITINDNGTVRIFKFRNGRIRTEAREDVMASTSNPVSTLDPGNYGAKGSGLCSTFYPGPAGVDRPSGGTNVYPITLRKGDTVTVGARRAVAGPQGLGIQNAPAPGLTASFTLDGVAVNIRGELSSEQGPGEAFSFSYTTR